MTIGMFFHSPLSYLGRLFPVFNLTTTVFGSMWTSVVFDLFRSLVRSDLGSLPHICMVVELNLEDGRSWHFLMYKHQNSVILISLNNTSGYCIYVSLNFVLPWTSSFFLYPSAGSDLGSLVWSHTSYWVYAYKFLCVKTNYQCQRQPSSYGPDLGSGGEGFTPRNRLL